MQTASLCVQDGVCEREVSVFHEKAVLIFYICVGTLFFLALTPECISLNFIFFFKSCKAKSFSKLLLRLCGTRRSASSWQPWGACPAGLGQLHQPLAAMCSRFDTWYMQDQYFCVGKLKFRSVVVLGVLLVPGGSSSCSGEMGCHLAHVILAPPSCIQCYRAGELALAKHEAGSCSVQPRTKALQPVESFRGAYLTESTLFFNFFLFFQFSQMLGFVSHLCVIKSRLLVTEELVERRGFPPVCHFMLGCEKSWAHVAPGRHLAWVQEPGRGGRAGKEGPWVQWAVLVELCFCSWCVLCPGARQRARGALLCPGMEWAVLVLPATHQSFILTW